MEENRLKAVEYGKDDLKGSKEGKNFLGMVIWRLLFILIS